MKKVILEINKKKETKLFELLNYFDNVFYKFAKETIHIEIYIERRSNELYFVKKLLDKEKYIIKRIKNKNWLKHTQNIDSGYQTKYFFFHQNLKSSPDIINKKIIIIPAGMAFGTGGHESTELAVRLLEDILKKASFYNPIDIGTGTGILTFVIKTFIKRKTYSTDLNIDSMKCFNYNKKINNFNNLIFVRCSGIKAKVLQGKKFDLIVANLLLNEHKEIVKSLCLKLKKKGILIISGILYSEKNYFIAILRGFDLKFVKYTNMENWIGLVFKKN